MTIKPPGGTPLTGPFVGAPDNAAGKPGARTVDSASFADQLQGSEPSGVVSRFTQADLKDPQAVDKMVRQTVDELLRNDWSGPAGLSEADRKNLVDFMSADPTVHHHVERWLHKVLK